VDFAQRPAQPGASIDAESELVGLLVLVERVRAADDGGILPLSLLQGGTTSGKAWGLYSPHVKRAQARIAELTEFFKGNPHAPTEYKPGCPIFLKHLVVFCYYKVR
jgi:hypothetical protein